MSEYEGKVVVITGGGGGIGKAAAARFLDEGASVVLSSRRREVLETARRELDADDRIALVPGDVSSPEAAAELIDTAVDRFGGVDVLVNSTGIFRVTPFLEQTEEQFRGSTRFDPAADLLHIASGRAQDGRAWGRRDRQRRLDVGPGRNRDHSDEHLLSRAGRAARADQELGDRARRGEYPRQHCCARVRRDSGLRAVYDRRAGPQRARVRERVPSAGTSRLSGRRRRGDPLSRR